MRKIFALDGQPVTEKINRNSPSVYCAQTFVRLSPFDPNIFPKYTFREEKKNYSGNIDKQRPLDFARMRGFLKTGEFRSF